MKTVMMGKRGTLVVPAGLRKRYRLEEGSLLLLEERPDGILAIPATAVPARPKSKAERQPKKNGVALVTSK